MSPSSDLHASFEPEKHTSNSTLGYSDTLWYFSTRFWEEKACFNDKDVG